MTSNQVSYWRNKETERANRAAEALKRYESRSDRVKAISSLINAKASSQMAQSDKVKALSSLINAQASREQAGASTSQAEVAQSRNKWERTLKTIETFATAYNKITSPAASLAGGLFKVLIP